jgi:hypothetical protein
LSGTLSLEIETARLDQVITDVLVIPFFSCDRPLRGASARADWRLCGLLSECLQREDLTGEWGEAALVPTGGRMRSPILLVMGLGPRSDFGEEILREMARSATLRLLGLRLPIAGITFPDQVASRLDASREASIAIEGVAAVLSEHQSGLRLRLVVTPEEAGRARSGLLETAGRLSSSELAIRLEQSSGISSHSRAISMPQTESPAGNPAHRADFRH